MNEKPLKIKDREYYLFAFRIVSDFGATIAIPVVAFVLIGQYFDHRFSKGLLFTGIGFILAALISGRIIYRKAKLYGTEYQSLMEKKKQ